MRGMKGKIIRRDWGVVVISLFTACIEERGLGFPAGGYKLVMIWG